MSFLTRSQEEAHEAAEPLFRDSDEEHEKRARNQAEIDAERKSLRASVRRLRRWLIAVSIMLVIASLSTLFSYRDVVLDHKASKNLSFAPPMPTEIIKFEQYDDFASPSTPTADEAWGHLNPPGDGFVLIPNREDYSLPPGKPTERGDVYDISVFHQLHCLNHVRTFLFTMKAGMDLNNTQQVYDTILKAQEDHVYHCFDYIRQALMCHADLTVEWPRTEADGRRFAVDGWGIEHQCKSWDAVLEFMNEHTVARAFDD